ncbi:DEAD/DEAH box helicase [Cellvibrio sp. PSBB023]|uniref:DEAD/DEAH box helicase n=1 Tax=Cellvibrio sp. PSBB023 TaxID=1945512 RepID=UPI00352D8E7B
MIGKLFKKLIGSGADKPEKNEAKPVTDKPTAKKHPRERSGQQQNNRGNRNSRDQRPGQKNEQQTPAVQRDTSAKPPRHSAAPRPKKAQKVDHGPWDISQFAVEEVEGKSRFHDFDLEPQIMRAIADLGFKYCSPIQAQSLPHALQGKDVVGKAQTGTGKTAAFLTAIIDDLLKNPITEKRYAGEARALVIAPTRELVIQIADDAKNLCKYTDLKIHTLVGGMDYVKQQRHLHEDFVDILVATPGRLLDFCGNKDVYLDQLEILVIDEADRMLDMGFIPQVRQIVRQTPSVKTVKPCFSLLPLPMKCAFW